MQKIKSLIVSRRWLLHGQHFQMDLFNIARTIGPRTTKLSGRDNTWGRSLIVGVSLKPVNPTARGRGPSAPQFWVPFLFMLTPFGMVTQVGRDVYLGVSHGPIPVREQSSRAMLFPFVY